MIRKLASIQKIISVELIENADRIEKIKVLGWQIVVKKGEFKPGQLCVYCEIDSVLPEKPEFEFLRPKKFRIKTTKLHGIISQGIAFPLSILSDDDRISILEEYHMNGNEHIIGQNVTEKLGIIKFEIPISPGQKGNTKRPFPKHLIPETDELRIQSIPKVLEEIKGKEVYATEKVDGTSYTVFHNLTTTDKDGIIELTSYVGVCSRHQELKDDGDIDVYWRITHKLKIEEKLRKYYEDHKVNLAIQGEICGKGTQGNKLGLKEDELFVYNVWNIDEQRYYGLVDFEHICAELGLKTIKILWQCKFNFSLDELVEIAKGKYSGTKNNREGIVVRPVEECFSETIMNYSPELKGRMSFKVMNIDYHLKEEG